MIVQGKFGISDETGPKTTTVPGDMFYFPMGAKITSTADGNGLAFFVRVPSLEQEKTTADQYCRRGSGARAYCRMGKVR